MRLLKLLFGSNHQTTEKKKTKAEIQKEKQELERKFWELAEEYEEEE